MELGKKIKLAGLLKRLGGNADSAILTSITEEIQSIRDYFDSRQPQVIEKTTQNTVVIEGKPGEPGKDATPLDPKPIIEKVKQELMPFMPQGGNLPGRRWQVNGSVIGAMFNDVNIVAPSATAANDIPNKRTTLTIPGGGGEGTPASPDTSVQFNDGGSFGGSADFTFNKNNQRITLINEDSGVTGTITGDKWRTNNGANSGDSGGGLSYITGDGNGSGNGGDFSFASGSGGDTGNGGVYQMTAGNGGATSGSGGSISLTAGSAQGGDSNGGDVEITPGAGGSPGVNGHVIIIDPISGLDAILDTSLLSSSDKTFKFQDNSGSLVITNGHARATGQTAANTNVLTQAVGAADGTFTVHANVLVTTSTLHSFGVTVDYTDESNTARTLTIPFSQLAGTLITAITNATGASAYEGVSLIIRAKASTNIIFKTAGTFTTVTYNVDASVVQIA